MNNFMIARTFMFTGVFGLFITSAAAQDTYCAFEVRVHSPTGTPVSNVTVALFQAQTTTFSQTTTDASGVARLCNAPLEYMEVIGVGPIFETTS